MYRIGLTAVSLAAMTFAAQAQTIQVNKDNRTIAITTTDEAQAVADRAVVSVGYTVYGSDQDSTYADASKVSNAVIKVLRDAGVKAEAIESKEQSLTPLDDNDKARYSKGIRFVATQSWGVTVAAKDAAQTLHLAITAGANNSGGIDWQLVDDQALQSEAAAKALVHAQAIAEQMTKGMHVALGPLIYASNEPPEPTFYKTGTLGGIRGAVMKMDLKPLAITPAKISKSATVYAVFSLQ